MILAKTADKAFAVIFSHKMTVHYPLHELIPNPVRVKSTQCDIFYVDEHGHMKLPRLARGVAKCSPLDQFVKAIGRKLALTRALDEQHPFTKAERTAIWTAYWGRK